MTETLTLSQLFSSLWKAAWHLKGPVDAADCKTYIFPLLFYKRLCDVFDEKTITALRESGGETQAQTDDATETATTALQSALSAWLENSAQVRAALKTILEVSS